jgi:pilus assembly protein CpaC
MARFESPSGEHRRARASQSGMKLRLLGPALLLGATVGLCATEGTAQQPAAGTLPLGIPGPGSPPLFLPNPGTSATVPLISTAAATGQPEGQPKVDPQKLPPPGPYSGPLSNPLLSPGPNGLPRATQPTPATQEKIAKYVARMLDPETTLDLVTHQTRVLMLKGTPIRIQSGDEGILAINVVTPREILLQGKGVGATVLNIWFGDKNDPAKQETLTYLVRVFPDPEAKQRLERAYKTLEDEINKYFKDTSIHLKVVGDKLVVSGRVRDFVQGGQVLQIIRQSMQGGAGGDTGKIPLVPAGGVPDPAGANPLSPETFASAGGPNVINLIEVAGEQQVQLRVVVCEVNRAAARSIGLNFSVRDQQGITVFSNGTGPVLGNTGVGFGGSFGGGVGGGSGSFGFGGQIANLSFTLDAGRLPFALSALKTLQYARSLAEPTLVTLNGQTANFLAGGQFPVPIIGGFGGFGGGGGGLQGVQYVPYGVIMNYTPYITDRDRIRLALSATVSTRDLRSGTSIGGGTVAGLNSRSVNTTVELRQGETLAIAGLIEYNLGADSTRVPFIGDIPGLNNLTGLQRIQAGEKELVIFVTPELTRPLDLGQVARLPGSEILDPNDCEFYLLGRLEGHCKDYRTPIRTDLSRIRMYHTVEQSNVYGPAGYSPQTYP